MTTFFDKIPHLYNNVKVEENKHIDTASFLDATEAMTRLFDSLGTAFTPVKSDIMGNVTAIRNKFNTNPSKYSTLQKIVSSEKAEGTASKGATHSLMWLKRGLDFTSQALRRNLSSKDEELSTSFTKAYEVTLSAHHSFLIRPVFSLAMKACPRRKDFYESLGQLADPVKFDGQFESWLKALETIMAILVQLYREEGIDK